MLFLFVLSLFLYFVCCSVVIGCVYYFFFLCVFFFFLLFFFVFFFFFFFFQAEDGIRDLYVTGVQTCALPISSSIVIDSWAATRFSTSEICSRLGRWKSKRWQRSAIVAITLCDSVVARRSEERRVGKSVDLGGRRIIKKKRIIKKETTDKTIK